MALKYHGLTLKHDAMCSCCVNDAARASSDPTGTRRLRNKYKAVLRIRWQALRLLVRKMLVDQDLLSRTSVGLTTIGNPSIQAGQSKVRMFQRWFDHLLDQQVLGRDGSFMRPFIEQAYDDGASFGRSVLRQPIVHRLAKDRADTLFALAVTELQGIEEAVSQQAVRVVTNGLLQGKPTKSIVREIWSVIDRIGITRSKALVEVMVNKSFNEAVLDIYEAAKVKNVGLVPETKTALSTTDARRRGPGSRSSRSRTPSRSTIGRIRRAEREVERLGKVNVRTAGDDKVCAICEGIAEDGPYTINRARSLIPAHPNCRCTFVPVGDRRFAPDARVPLG